MHLEIDLPTGGHGLGRGLETVGDQIASSNHELDIRGVDRGRGPLQRLWRLPLGACVHVGEEGDSKCLPASPRGRPGGAQRQADRGGGQQLAPGQVL